MAKAKSKSNKSILEAVGETPVSPAAAKAKSDKALNAAQQKDRQNYLKVQREPSVSVSIAPMYAPWFGDIMAVGLNGMYIYVPCNGRTHKVPQSFASIIHRRLRTVDKNIAMQKRMGDVSRNYEPTVGSLELIPK